MRRTLLFSALLLALLAGLAATRLTVRPPDLRASAQPGQFDAERAMVRLSAILGNERPHPADSAGNDAVRARLVAQIRGLGLNPIVRDQFACNDIHKYRGVSCARVRNVIVALGPTSGRALLLNAHYDSTPVGPAAADAGAGVAALLEVAAILKSERLQRPVLFLFNEGEELGLVGARAFLADPLSEKVDSLINLEARGTTGPVTMFETSVPNGPAVRAFQRAVDRPFANSLATDFYRQLPNYTDVNSFEERRWTTFNFAMIGNETRYHSAGDNLAALDLRSLQHMGDQALSLARELQSGVARGSGSLLFADIGGRLLLTVPTWIGVELLGLLAAAFAWLSYRRGGMWRGLAVMFTGLIAAGAIAWICLFLLGHVRDGSFWRAFPLWTQTATWSAGLLAAVAAIALIGRDLEARQLRASFWLAFLLLGLAVLFVAPGGIIFFLLPPLVAIAAIFAGRWFDRAELAGAIAAALLLWLTLGEVLALLGDLIVDGPFFIFAPLALLIAMPWLIEARDLVTATGRTRPILVAAIVSLAGWSVAAGAPAYSADRQQRFSLQHATDMATGRSYWAVANDRASLPDDFAPEKDWRWRALPYSEQKRWIAPAPSIDGLRAPQIEVLRKSSNGKARTVEFRLRSNRAERVTLTAGEDSQLVSAGIGGFVRSFSGSDKGNYHLSCTGRSCDGAKIQVTTLSAEPVEFTVTGIRQGLPDEALPLLDRRPRFARPQYVPDSTLTLARIRL